MGCDIHAMIEKRVDSHLDGWEFWHNAGDPSIGRNYELFSILANVRNSHDIPFISEPRNIPENASDEMKAWHDSWGEDAHSASFVTLKELKEFNLDQEFYDNSWVTKYGENGKIEETCAWSSNPSSKLGEVGRRKIFALWGREDWDILIAKMQALSDGRDEWVRLVFFFDN